MELKTEEECLTCPEGSWCSAGKEIKCGIGTYNDQTASTDQSACTYCPLNAVTLDEKQTSLAGCVCEAGHYADWSLGQLTCNPCPVGANCSARGAELAALPLEVGYWRANASTTDVRRCAGEFEGSSCVGVVGGACKEGLEGPYCALCSASSSAFSFSP